MDVFAGSVAGVPVIPPDVRPIMAAPSRAVPARFAAFRLAPLRLAPARSAPWRSAKVRMHPDQSTPGVGAGDTRWVVGSTFGQLRLTATAASAPASTPATTLSVAAKQSARAHDALRVMHISPGFHRLRASRHNCI